MKRIVNLNSGDSNSIDFKPVFLMLNDELSKIGESLELICAGGYVMQLYGFRGTADIDAFYQSSASIDRIIQKVGDAFGINRPDELWLNNSISNMNPTPPSKYCNVVHQLSHLVVMGVDLIYLLGMKFASARGQDMKDLVEIIKCNEELQPLTLMSKLGEMGFDIDISMLIDAFEGARGMEWLDAFYKENEDEICKYY